MTEDGDEIPLGIVLSMILFAAYIYILNKLTQTLKIDNWIISSIYFIPFIFLYIAIPILLRKRAGKNP